MKIAGDTHTHTVACGHAYSTVDENVRWAAQQGHKFIAITEHGPSMPCGPHKWFVENLHVLPPVLHGVAVLRGCESNVTPDGGVDLTDRVLDKLQWVIASMHRDVMPEGLSQEDYTKAWLAIAENPKIDCIGHMGQLYAVCDYERVVKAFAANGKAVEVNSGSFVSRKGSEANCIQIVKLCKEYGVPVVLSSDAHFYTQIGQVENSESIIKAADYPESSILNLDYERFATWLENKKGITLPRI